MSGALQSAWIEFFVGAVSVPTDDARAGGGERRTPHVSARIRT
jgi:hypothetical protein